VRADMNNKNSVFHDNYCIILGPQNLGPRAAVSIAYWLIWHCMGLYALLWTKSNSLRPIKSLPDNNWFK